MDLGIQPIVEALDWPTQLLGLLNVNGVAVFKASHGFSSTNSLLLWP